MSAGESYLLKLPTPDAPSVTFNELLGVVIAGLAGIPTAPYALVTVADLLPIESGEYFGSVILTGHAPLDPSYVSGFSEGERDELYFLLAFDLLILNNDRKFGDLLRSGNGPLIPGGPWERPVRSKLDYRALQNVSRQRHRRQRSAHRVLYVDR